MERPRLKKSGSYFFIYEDNGHGDGENETPYLGPVGHHTSPKLIKSHKKRRCPNTFRYTVFLVVVFLAVDVVFLVVVFVLGFEVAILNSFHITFIIS